MAAKLWPGGRKIRMKEIWNNKAKKEGRKREREGERGERKRKEEENWRKN